MNKREFLGAALADGKTHALCGPLLLDVLALSGLGPLWAVYDADKVPQMAAQPLAARSIACPWALYHIAVQVERTGKDRRRTAPAV